MANRIKLLFFIESVVAGGKERRLVELLTYLKGQHRYNLLLVLTEKYIHFTQFLNLQIPYVVVQRKTLKKDPRPFFQFFKVCKQFKPDMIHVWGTLNAIYSLPTVLWQNIPMINSVISNAPPNLSRLSASYWIHQVTFIFSSFVLANSFAGLHTYDAPQEKSRVVYNGVNLERFQISVCPDEIKKKLGIGTPFSIIMVANFSDKKDYDLFVDVAKCIFHKRKDISLFAVGDGDNFERIKFRIKNEGISNVVLTGKSNSVEPLIAAADIGFLFSPCGEGISNFILECLALGKPVIATDAGGTREIIQDGITGFLIKDWSPKQIANLASDLVDDKAMRAKMGDAGRILIENIFSLERMGSEFETIYSEVHCKKRT